MDGRARGAAGQTTYLTKHLHLQVLTVRAAVHPLTFLQQQHEQVTLHIA